MPVKQPDVCVGGIYSAGNNQERRVTKIEKGYVYWDSRGGNVQNDWSPGHTLSRPTPLDKFAMDCTGIVSIPSKSPL